ncbi:hypothetical protein ACEWY4_010075 [Coilia grayii]|uniref:PDZ domain-containing protein n=1 Tax=Coilia grayii TaxID=363190 RepID=A0ABD1K8I5_9TELE
MFHLIKKDKEKSEKDGGKKEKKEKKDKKERMSAAELKSLEEMGMRRGFFHLHRGGSKRDSKGKLEISSPIPIKVVSSMELSLSGAEYERIQSLGAPPQGPGQMSASSSRDELKKDASQEAPNRPSIKERAAKFGPLTKQNSQVGQIMKRFSFSQRSKEESPPGSTSQSGQNSTTVSPQMEAKILGPQLRPKAPPRQPVHIPELVEKSFPVDLRLPALVVPKFPEPRELELQRRNTGDFGFSLRRTAMLDHRPDGSMYRRVVHFAEPGSGSKDLALGLVPGDRLVEINGVNVESKNRDEIVEMIRQSGDVVRLKVQPIVELSELSRCWLRNMEGGSREACDVST